MEQRIIVTFYICGDEDQVKTIMDKLKLYKAPQYTYTMNELFDQIGCDYNIIDNHGIDGKYNASQACDIGLIDTIIYKEDIQNVIDILKHTYKDISVYYIMEDPIHGIFQTNDKDKICFDNRYNYILTELINGITYDVQYFEALHQIKNYLYKTLDIEVHGNTLNEVKESFYKILKKSDTIKSGYRIFKLERI